LHEKKIAKNGNKSIAMKAPCENFGLSNHNRLLLRLSIVITTLVCKIEWKGVDLMRTFSKNIFISLLGAVALLFVVTFPLAATSEKLAEPKQVIQEISKQLLDILQKEPARLKRDPAYIYQLVSEVLVPHVDFARVSSLVLGKRWRQATPEQKNEFSHQFQRLLVRTYFMAIREFGDWEIRYKSVRKNKTGDKVQILTQILRSGGEPVDVTYRMQLKSGSWMVYDIKIEGISLVTNYRSSFAKQLRQTGLDGLINRITAMNDKREKNGHS
jgi:phospholipid transport system substrate-binding protein